MPASRHALTLVELMIGMSLLSMLAVVLGGLVSAVNNSRNYTFGLEDANTQSQVALDRIKYIAAHTGVYQLSGQSTIPGMAVVTHDRNSETVPDTLVVWSGGRSGGMAEQGTLTRLPTVDELLIYTPSPDDPTLFVEIAIPGNSSEIDFNSADFAASIRTLITSDSAEMLTLMNRLRVVNLSNMELTSGETGCAWFSISHTPTDTEIASATVGTDSWIALPWVQGIASSSNGLRQLTIIIELQTHTDVHTVSSSNQSQPCFGALNYRYVYQP